MMAKKPETPEEQWEAMRGLVHAADDEDFLRTTDDEAFAHLRADGLDPVAIGERGQAFVLALVAEAEAKEAAAARVAGAASASEQGEPAVENAEPAVENAEPAVAKAEPAVEKAEPAVAKAEPGGIAPVVALEDARRRARGARRAWSTWLVAAAVIGAVTVSTALILALVDRNRTPVGPDHPSFPLPPKPHEPTPDELVAQTLRNEAYAACSVHDWAKCAGNLARAAQLDPAGDTTAVQTLRDSAARGMADDELRAPHARGDGGPKR